MNKPQASRNDKLATSSITLPSLTAPTVKKIADTMNNTHPATVRIQVCRALIDFKRRSVVRNTTEHSRVLAHVPARRCAVLRSLGPIERAMICVQSGVTEGRATWPVCDFILIVQELSCGE